MTELMWEGKYKDGKRVGPLRIALPFQTVETVNESGQVRAHQLALFQQGKATDWRNRLIWGDKKYVLPSLLEEFAGKVNLIYIDPPFATGANFSFTTTIPESDEALEKEPSMIEQKAYRDMWGRGLDSYLQWFSETVVLLRDLLTEDGSVYVHLDWRLNHYAKPVLDEVFGLENFCNDIRWIRSLPHNDPNQYGRSSDTILYFGKSKERRFQSPYIPQKEDSVDAHYREDQNGRQFRLASLLAPGNRGPKYSYKGFEKHWRFTEDKMQALEAEGRIFFREGQMPSRIYYLDESLGSQVQDV